MSWQTVQDVLSVVSVIVLLLGLVIGVWVFTKGAYAKARIEALQADLKSADERYAREHDTRISCVQDRDRYKSERDQARGENRILRDVVTQKAEVAEVRAEVKALIGMMSVHHQEALEAWDHIGEAIRGDKGDHNG